jgi:hypothetical protein
LAFGGCLEVIRTAGEQESVGRDKTITLGDKHTGSRLVNELHENAGAFLQRLIGVNGDFFDTR